MINHLSTKTCSGFDMVVSGIRDLSQGIITEHKEKFGKFPTQEEVKKMFISMSPGFANDKMFADLFPNIYGILFAESMMEKNDETVLTGVEDVQKVLNDMP